MDSVRYVLAVLIWATFPPAFIFWYLIHPFVGYWRRVGGPLQTYMVVVPICILVLGVLLRWNPVAGTDLGTNWILFGTGFALWVVSWWIERRVRRHLDFRTLVGVPELKWRSTRVPRIPTIDEFIGDDGEDETPRVGPDRAAPEAGEADATPVLLRAEPEAGADRPLIREGIFDRVRHPRYLAALVGITGWSLMAHHGASYLVAAIAFPALLGIIHFEEKELMERYGDEYRRYREEVPALIPRFGG